MPSQARILVTSSGARAAELRHKLTEAGAQPVHFPCVEISTGDESALEAALGLLSQFHWLIFDSAHSVEAFWARLAALGLDERIFREQRFGVLGKATARALTKHGPLAEFVAEPDASAEAVGKMGVVRGQWILILQSAEWEIELGKKLTTHGAVVRTVSAYTTQLPASAASGWAKVEPPVHAITFCEPMAAINFAQLLGPPAVGHSRVACL
ncbi:MAG: uroporphyrinogen-III synthase, partial [Anaerolineales bacterium]|nr:uroporphyrinogen-III synthase [Anaerolineales bacterium]